MDIIRSASRTTRKKNNFMPAAVVSIGAKRRGHWSLLEVAQRGKKPVPYGILLVDQETDAPVIRTRDVRGFEDLPEDELDFLEALPSDLREKGKELGGTKMLEWLEDCASNFIRVSDRTAVSYTSHRTMLDQLFDEHVDSTVMPFVSHLPLYSLRAAATKFGEGMEAEQEDWVRAPETLKLSEGMFVAYVVGRSMEPLIPDGSACVFRSPVTGSRAGRRLLIEKFDETDFSARYTVKRYARRGALAEGEEREQEIRLEPLNPEFEAFNLTSDKFRVVGEFVQVLQL